MTLIRIAVAIAAVAPLAQPQTTFEAASLKLSNPQGLHHYFQGGPGTSDPGQFSCVNVSLLELIAIAYNVDQLHVSSSDPLEAQHFDLTAILPAGVTRQQFRQMMQNLLAERFHLKTHLELKDFRVNTLLVAKGGPKLKDAGAATGPPAKLPGFPDLSPGEPDIRSDTSVKDGFILVRLRAQQEPISELAQALHTAEGPPIVDQTGLAGKYDFTLEYTFERPGASAEATGQVPPAPDLPTALREQLGLRMAAGKAPFHVVVVDSVNKLPTGN